jgi:endoglucanase
MKNLIKTGLLLIALFLFSESGYSQTGLGDNFNDNTLSCHWNGNGSYALTELGSELKVNATVSGGTYVVLELDFTSVNITANPILSLKIKSSSAFTVRADLQDAAGMNTNASPLSAAVPGTGVYNTYSFNFTGKFNQTFPSAGTVNSSQIAKIQLFVNPGGTAYNNTFYIDDVQLGTGGATDGAVADCPPLPPANLTTDIRLNQIGFYPNCPKVTVVKGTPSGSSFFIRSLDLTTTYFTGTLSAASTWSFSNESVMLADFTSFNISGQYRVEVPGIGASYAFTIAPQIHHNVNKASLKAYYHARSSSATTAANAGAWARAAGHPDNVVYIHSSAASAARPTGTVVSSPKGWYDAGDYNSYIVNSGISTYTLLASYEHFKNYYDTLNTNIPESGNALPDILDEIKWNLDWMLTMQDPNDGGVYNKKTCAAFDGFIMPAASSCTRYLVAKSTAATFDFAAVMAVAYRVYKPFDLTYANQCLAASQSAYAWAIANPAIYFTNPGGISTGEYGDGNVTDEKEWAASELYIATLNSTYYSNSFKNTNSYNLPAWPDTRTLGLISLIFNRKNLSAVGFADTTNMKNKLLSLANTYSNHWVSGSAYKVAMGGAGNADFVWGSNGVASNIGMVLLAAFEFSANNNHYYAALSNMDYLMGRNATTYCFVTSFGSNKVMHPHHRPSEADGITNPVPGFLAGGPDNDSPSDCGSGYPSTAYKALTYQDNICSYSTNEVAINWNAPFVFLSSALENLGPCGITPLPVGLLSFSGKKKDDKIKLSWITTDEKDIKGFSIQKSENGNQYHDIGFVEAKKYSGQNSYDFFDEQVLKKNYYRLKQIDKNGASTLSQVILIEGETQPIKIYPNPAAEKVYLHSPEIISSVSIMDINGKEILTTKPEGNPGEAFELPLDIFSNGIYMIKITTASRVVVEKLIVQK